MTCVHILILILQLEPASSVQVAFADVLLLNKLDLLGDEGTPERAKAQEEVTRKLHSINKYVTRCVLA